MQIVTQFSMSSKQYILEFENLQHNRPAKCPNCGVPNSLHTHGYYWRNVVSDKYEERIPIARFYCKVCSLTVSLLPNFVLPYFQYSLEFIIAALRIIFLASFKITALQRFYRCRFYRNLTRIEMFCREQGWLGEISTDKKERAKKLVCMLTVPTAETFSQRFHQQYKLNFMAH